MALEFTSDSLSRPFFGLQPAALLLALFLVAFTLDGPAALAGVCVVGVLLVVTGVVLWRYHTGRTDVAVIGTPGNITFRPLVFPGQAPKER